MDARGSIALALLAWINHRVEEISEAQHRLARTKALLREQATQLRLGAPAPEVRLALRRAGVLEPGDAAEWREVASRAA